MCIFVPLADYLSINISSPNINGVAPDIILASEMDGIVTTNTTLFHPWLDSLFTDD